MPLKKKKEGWSLCIIQSLMIQKKRFSRGFGGRYCTLKKRHYKAAIQDYPFCTYYKCTHLHTHSLLFVQMSELGKRVGDVP